MLFKILAWPVRFAIYFFALITAIALIFFVPGMLFTYLSWCCANGTMSKIIPALFLGFVTYRLTRWWEGDKPPAARRSELEPIWLGQKSSGQNRLPRWIPIPKSFFGLSLSIDMALVGGVGHAIFQGLAVDSLGLVGSPSVPILVRLAGGDNKGVREEALTSLEKLGPKAATAAPWLIQHADAKGYIGSLRVDTLLIKFGKPVSLELVKFLNRDDPRPLESAVRVLCAVPPAPDAVPELLETIKMQQRPGERAVDPVYLQRAVLRVLIAMGPDAAASVPVLISRLSWLARSRDRQNEEEESVLKILERNPEVAVNYLPELLDALKASEKPQYYVKVFSVIGAKAVEPLRQLLQQPRLEKSLKMEILQVFRLMGTTARAVSEDLRRIQEGTDERLSLFAAAALVRLQHQAAPSTEMLLAALASPRHTQRYIDASYLVGELGPDGLPFLPTYLQWLKGKDETLRQNAIYYIGKLKSANSPAVEGMGESLRGARTPYQQELALKAIQQMGSDASSAEVTIREVMPELDIKTQLFAAIVLQEITGKPDSLAEFALNHTKEQLKEVSYSLGEIFVRSAEKFGPNARPLLRALEKLYQEELLGRGSCLKILDAIDTWERIYWELSIWES